jgi:hypothetical protein
MGGLTRWATAHGVGSIPLQTTFNVRWTRELTEVMRPFTTGSDYVNQIGLETDEGSERIKAAYGVNYERLAAVKNRMLQPAAALHRRLARLSSSVAHRRHR